MGLLDVDTTAKDFIVTLAGGKQEPTPTENTRRSYQVEPGGVLAIFYYGKHDIQEIVRYSPHAWEKVTEAGNPPTVSAAQSGAHFGR